MCVLVSVSLGHSGHARQMLLKNRGGNTSCMDYESQLWPSFCFKGLFAQEAFLPYSMYFYWLKIYENILFQMTTTLPTDVPAPGSFHGVGCTGLR